MTYDEGQSYLVDVEEGTKIQSAPSTIPEDREVKKLKKKVEDQVRNNVLSETDWRLPGAPGSLILCVKNDWVSCNASQVILFL